MAGFDWNQYPAEGEAAPVSDRPPAKGGKAAKFDWNQYPAEGQEAAKTDEGGGFLSDSAKAMLSGIGKVGKTVDSYGGAPTRAALGSLQKDPMNPDAAISAFKNQFGADPSLAPTGKELAARLGMSTQPILSPGGQRMASSMMKGTPLGFVADKMAPGSVEHVAATSPAGAAGLGIDIAADPLTYVPLGKAAEGAVGVVAKSADRIGKAADVVGRAAKSVGATSVAKIGSALTGASEQEIKTFITQYPEVQKMIAEHGNDITGAADQVRQSFQTAIRSKRAELGNQVGKALDALPNEQVVPITPVLDSLNQVKGRMNSSLRFEEIQPIDEMISRITNLANKEGNVTPKEMFDIKQYLQDRGSGSYMKDGQIFVPGKDSQLAAKNGAAQARQLVNTMSPAVADSNNQLYKLHLMETNLNKNLIAPGKSDAALTGAGSGLNPGNESKLKQLGDTAGMDMLGSAQQYAAAKRFASPGLTTSDTTGKGAERFLKAGFIGQVFGGPVAGAIAAAVTSPMALKLAIQTGRIPVAAIEKLTGIAGDLSDATVQQAYRILKTAEGQTAFNSALQGGKVQSIVQRPLRNVAQGPTDQNNDRKPAARGPDAWAQQGLQKLGIDDPAMIQRILEDKNGKQLLIQASDLAPDSKAMQNIRSKIKKGWGQ